MKKAFRHPFLRSVVHISAFLLLPGLAACGPEAGDAPAVQSLVDLWPEVEVSASAESAVAAAETPAAAALRFDGSGPAFSWKVLQGAAEVRVEDGVLVGRATSGAPVILLEVETPLGVEDQLHSVEVRLRASAGSRLGIHPIPEPGAPLPVVLARVEDWPLFSALVPGDEATTYTVETAERFLLEMRPATTSVRKIALRPTNEPGAEFALESVRMVFRKQRLAAIPSGPGWHGLGEVYRETLVARAPEALRFRLTLPVRPWLDLSVGSVEDPAPAFEVEVTAPGSPPETVATLTAEEPETWKPERVDLGRWAGQTVELALVATAPERGALAFWGAPTVRSSLPEANSSEAGRPRAVVVFLADTLRRDHLDAWGYGRETAPTLTRLAAEGARFEEAFSQATWTKSSVSSILSSLYPSTTGIADLHDRLAAGETTLAEAFRGAGYATFATSSVPFTGQLTNLHQGVEVLHEFGANPIVRGEYQSKTAKGWVDAYLAWLELHAEVPTFAFVHVMDPHSPFEPAAPYDAMWTEPGDSERFAAQSEQVVPHIEHPLMRRFVAPSAQELAAAGVDAASFVAHEKAWYDGSIRGLDAELERVVERLEALGLGESALLAFVSDHGEEFLEHGRHFHGTSVYGELTAVPLVLWGQGVPAGRTVEQPVQALDLMPTLLDLAGIEVPERAQGRSLVPLLRGEAVRPQPAFSEHREQGREGGADHFAIVADGFKLVWHDGAAGDVPAYELFDAHEDPLDQHDVAAEHPEVVQRLAAQLEAWRAWAEGEKLDQEEAEAALSAEELEHLRSLGYVE